MLDDDGRVESIEPHVNIVRSAEPGFKRRDTIRDARVIDLGNRLRVRDCRGCAGPP